MTHIEFHEGMYSIGIKCSIIYRNAFNFVGIIEPEIGLAIENNSKN